MICPSDGHRACKLAPVQAQSCLEDGPFTPDMVRDEARPLCETTDRGKHTL